MIPMRVKVKVVAIHGSLITFSFSRLDFNSTERRNIGEYIYIAISMVEARKIKLINKMVIE